MLIFSVFDAKALAYLQPIFCKTEGLAVRSFTAAVEQVGHDFNRYAEDYSLWLLGEFDEQAGGFVNATPL